MIARRAPNRAKWKSGDVAMGLLWPSACAARPSTVTCASRKAAGPCWRKRRRPRYFDIPAPRPVPNDPAADFFQSVGRMNRAGILPYLSRARDCWQSAADGRRAAAVVVFCATLFILVNWRDFVADDIPQSLVPVT